ncbi:ankyrin repeat domain-containing protein [Flavobacterium sp. ALJ2]|uniref:ankyrin repeat domain-containing protein n=1 Tax=Flavobacterium sp. ALJ2 TaxID=2786960 RepID=UPI00189F81A3|nr:ankyrin repeat domain-containing protein [Flavobacterium sp. ALJ2]MBF7092235.1 ankyrin repeat domain-containing protein [Flavobacterium sp. ALJ2]
MNYLNKSIVLIVLCIGFIISCKKEKPATVVPKIAFVYGSKEAVEAIKEGDLQKVKQYIDKGGDPNARCKGYTRGSREEGKENRSDKDWTLLMYAVFHNKAEVAKFLLSKKADVNAVNAVGHSALFLACANNYEEIALLLLENGADVNIGKDNSGMSALQWALAYDLNDLSLKLINKGADLNTFSTETGRSVLMEAFYSDSIKSTIAHRIIDLGGDVRFVDPKHQQTPLMWACRKNDTTSVKKIIKKGGNVNLESDSGYTALEFAAGNTFQDVALIRYLVSKGAIVNNKNVPLVDAVYSGSIEKVKFLVENGADVNKRKAMNGIPPLFEAGFNTKDEIAAYLIDNGADVNIENPNGESVLYYSLTSFNGSYKIVKLLIDKGANVNFINNDKRTALMKAAQFNTVDIASLLIENGASKDGVDVYGKTAKMYAEESADRTGDKKILSLFE